MTEYNIPIYSASIFLAPFWKKKYNKSVLNLDFYSWRNVFMKFYTYKTKDTGKEELAIGYANDENILYPLHQFDMSFTDMTDLIAHITPAELQILSLASQKEDLRFLFK